MTEGDIVYERGDYWVSKAVFGTGRLKPKSKGFKVWLTNGTHSRLVFSCGFEGEAGLARCKREIERRIEGGNV